MIRPSSGFLIVILLSTSCFAQKTASSVSQKLQTQLLAMPGISLSFSTENEGHISIEVDVRAKRLRVESPTTLIISDGSTIWNYDKKADRETIDNVTATSEFHDPASLFRFADNYTASLTTSDGKRRYTLILTPTQVLQSLLKSAGEMRSLRLDLELRGSHVIIRNASAASSRGTTQIEHLQLKSVTRIQPSDFVFRPKASTKVIDLRE